VAGVLADKFSGKGKVWGVGNFLILLKPDETIPALLKYQKYEVFARIKYDLRQSLMDS